MSKLRVGFFGGRGDSRGLCYQSQGFCKWLQPTRIVGLDMTTDNLSPYPNDWSPFTQPLTVLRPSEITEEFVKTWANDLDVVLAVETFYKEEVVLWLRDIGVPSVSQINPELCGYYVSDDPRPDVIVAPTTWLMNQMPGAIHLPFPVDRSVFPFRPRTQARHYVHVAGHRAMGDRAGTRLVLGAAQRRMSRRKRGEADWSLTIRSQSPLGYSSRTTPNFKVEVGNIADPRDLYADANVIIHPRRYGGNDLVANEALSSGCPIIVLNREPENKWGGCYPLKARNRVRARTKGGQIQTYDSNPVELLRVMDLLTSNDRLVEGLSHKADAYAASISWDAMLPVWMDFLQAVKDGDDPSSVLCNPPTLRGTSPPDLASTP